MALSDLDKAKAFATSEDLRTRMQAAGVISVSELTYMTPVREAPGSPNRCRERDGWQRGSNVVLVLH
jgi:hypothetical protein